MVRHVSGYQFAIPQDRLSGGIERSAPMMTAALGALAENQLGAFLFVAYCCGWTTSTRRTRWVGSWHIPVFKASSIPAGAGFFHSTSADDCCSWF